MTFFDALANFEEYEPDDDDIIDEDYIICSVCGLIVLKSSDPRANNHRCCEDCYFDKFWDEENLNISPSWYDE